MRNRQEERLRCRYVSLCAGSIETSSLLLMNGLANSSGQVGRNLMAHTALQIWGEFDEDVRPYKGIPGAIISEDPHRPGGRSGVPANFVGGYLLQSIGAMPVTYLSQMAQGRGLWGEDLKRAASMYNHVAGINILGDCLPYEHNFLELSDEKDNRGLPKPRVYFSNGESEERMTAHADKIMREV